MKKRTLSLLLALAMCLGLAVPALAAGQLPYNDVSPSAWYYNSVWYVTQNGLMNGTSGNVFSPDTSTTRGMFVTMLHRLEGEPRSTGVVSFLDVPEGSYYADAVAWARANELVRGYGDGRFGPDDVLTREQMALMFFRYADYKGYSTETYEGLGSFVDADACNEYALTAMRWAFHFHLINGVGAQTLAPQRGVIRSEIATMLMRFEENLGPTRGSNVLSNFSTSGTEFIVGDECSITFTVNVAQDASEDVYLCSDGDNQIAQMRDDGEGGDAVAGDGVYTAVWTTTVDSVYEVGCYAKTGDCVSRRLNIRFLEGGTLSGRVCTAADQTVGVANADLSVYRDGLLYTSGNTNEEGHYSFQLPSGNYHVEANCDGCVPFNSYATVTGGSNTYAETYLMVAGTVDATGTATGTITSALTGLGLEGVVLTVRKGWNNTSVGPIVANTITDANGNYTLYLPVGNYTIYCTKADHIGVVVNIIATVEPRGQQDGSISPIVTSGNYRVVLTWGESPRDLDSHMEGKRPDGSSYHVYFSAQNAYSDGVTSSNLDVDDTTSYGPETVTLDVSGTEPYYYYVHRYSDSGQLATSGAVVRLYRGDLLLNTFNVPTDQDNGRYWNVFAIKNGSLQLKNTITSSPDTGYAS